MDTQDKFIKVVKGLAEARGLELVEDWSWANIGILRFQRKNSFVPLRSIRVDFQSTYEDASFRYTGFVKTPERKHLSSKFTELDTVIEFIAADLAKE